MAGTFGEIGATPEQFELLVAKQIRAVVIRHTDAMDDDPDHRPPRVGDILRIGLQLEPGKPIMESPSLGRRITYVETVDIETGIVECVERIYVCSIADGLGYK